MLFGSFSRLSERWETNMEHRHNWDVHTEWKKHVHMQVSVENICMQMPSARVADVTIGLRTHSHIRYPHFSRAMVTRPRRTQNWEKHGHYQCVGNIIRETESDEDKLNPTCSQSDQREPNVQNSRIYISLSSDGYLNTCTSEAPPPLWMRSMLLKLMIEQLSSLFHCQWLGFLGLAEVINKVNKAVQNIWNPRVKHGDTPAHVHSFTTYRACLCVAHNHIWDVIRGQTKQQ